MNRRLLFVSLLFMLIGVVVMALGLRNLLLDAVFWGDDLIRRLPVYFISGEGWETLLLLTGGILFMGLGYMIFRDARGLPVFWDRPW